MIGRVSPRQASLHPILQSTGTSTVDKGQVLAEERDGNTHAHVCIHRQEAGYADKALLTKLPETKVATAGLSKCPPGKAGTQANPEPLHPATGGQSHPSHMGSCTQHRLQALLASVRSPLCLSISRLPKKPSIADRTLLLVCPYLRHAPEAQRNMSVNELCQLPVHSLGNGQAVGQTEHKHIQGV